MPPIMPARLPASIEVGAERRSDRPFLRDLEFCRQGARTQLHGERIRLRHTEIPGDLARALEDRFVDDGCGEHFVVEHDRKRLADVVLGEGSELAGAGLIEAEVDHRLAVATVEAGLGVRQFIALDDGIFVQQVLAALFSGARIDLVVLRHTRQFGICRACRRVHGMERKLSRFADGILELGCVLQSGILDENAVGALADNGRFRSSERIDAAVDSLDRRRGGVGDALANALFRRLDEDGVGFRALDHFEIVAARTEDGVRKRLRQLLQGLHRSIELLGLRKLHLQRAVLHADAGGADLLVAQVLANGLAQRVEPVLLDRLRVHGEQQMRAAAKIETEVDLRLGHRPRPRLHRFLGKEIRQRRPHPCEAGEQDGEYLPAGEMQHIRRFAKLEFES